MVLMIDDKWWPVKMMKITSFLINAASPAEYTDAYGWYALNFHQKNIIHFELVFKT